MKLDSLQTNTSVISSVLQMDNQLLWRWYRDHLSGFREAEADGSHYCHDLVLSEKERVRVPIFKPENIGSDMAIDEKQIGEEMHTILSNRKTGKIAVMACSLRFQDLQKILSRIEPACRKVETLTRDLSPLYAKVGNDLFFNASAIADKFHLIRSLLDCCQDVRVRLRQEQLRQKRIAHDKHKKGQKEKQRLCKEQNLIFEKDKFKYKEEKLSNGETVLEALARSRYLLFKYPEDQTEPQKKRAKALFEKYPEIQKAYECACLFRNWMKKENIGKSGQRLKEQLNGWFKKVEEDGIDEMLNFMSLVERNILPIMNYFRFGATNAMAEAINSRIQRFVMINQGEQEIENFSTSAQLIIFSAPQNNI